MSVWDTVLTLDDMEFLASYKTGKLDMNEFGKLASLDGKRRALSHVNSDEVFQKLFTEDKIDGYRPSLFLMMMALSKRVLEARDVTDDDLNLYVADMLTRFMSADKASWIEGTGQLALDYFGTVIGFVEARHNEEKPEKAAKMFQHVGEVSLVLSGVFVEHLLHRYNEERKPSGLSHYEKMGTMAFGRASSIYRHRESAVEQLSDFGTFRKVREALTLTPAHMKFDTLEQRLLKGRMHDRADAAPLSEVMIESGATLRDFRVPYQGNYN